MSSSQWGTEARIGLMVGEQQVDNVGDVMNPFHHVAFGC